MPPAAGKLQTEDYLPGAMSGAAGGYGLKCASFPGLAEANSWLGPQLLAGSLQLRNARDLSWPASTSEHESRIVYLVNKG